MNGIQGASASRRKFLYQALSVWTLAGVATLGKSILDFLTPGAAAGPPKESAVLGPENGVAPGSARIFRFGKDPVIVVHEENGQYKAFNARCTHLGCVVQYQDAPVPHFNCNCHGSQYDLNGVNIAGPAPRPLTPYRIDIVSSNLVVTRT